MKLLVVIPAVGLSYGGSSKSVLELSEAIARHGVEVDIVTTNADTSVRLQVPLQQWIAEASYRIQYFPYWHIKDYKLSPALTQWLFAHVSDYDLVHTHAVFSLPTTAAYWACHYHRVPYVMAPHGMLEPWALSYKAWKKQIYYRWIEAKALTCARAIHVLTLAEAENVAALGLKTPTISVPNGIHADDFATLPDPTCFYQHFPETQTKTLILFMGRLDPKKGLDLLAHAFTQVHARFPNTHLVIAGPDNIGFLPTAHHYFAAAGCLSAVTFTGLLSGTLKYSAFAAADLYVAPSYSEGFSMSVLEGMASGLPCVITQACNFPEAAIAQAAHVVDVTSDAIATALIHCLTDLDSARAMGDRARQLIFDHYSWDTIAQLLHQTYTTILHQPSSLSYDSHISIR